MNIKATLEQRISNALAAAGVADAPAMVALSGRPEFGDYQANGCMAAAKKMKTNPRQLAETVLQHLDLSDLAEKVELAGPGFMNIFLKQEWLNEQLTVIAKDEKLGVPTPTKLETAVVDYSSPNLAKEMHVGHLRSTIIGDALSRVLDYVGYNVVRQNHVGDFGTQFGMLVARLDELGVESANLSDLTAFYQQAKRRFDEDEAFVEKTRQYVLKLQQGDPVIRSLWKKIVDASMDHARDVYDRLGILLTDADIRGESAFEEDLPKVVEALQSAGLLAHSEGAQGVYLEEFKNKDDEPSFIIVEKTGGGYLYTTTDLAAIRHRVGTLGAVRVLYLVGAEQTHHLKCVFLIARKAGFVSDVVSLEHIPFGLMLGTDGKPFKTRQGGTVKLMDLIDEAQSRAETLVKEKNPDLSEADIKNIAHTVGIGALKYADLSQNRTSDYVFSWDKMLSLEGNTAPYMQYAYARIQSIFRKQEAGSGACRVEAEGEDGSVGTIHIIEPAERTLAVKLLQFPETIEAVAELCMPNILCAYLYDVAGAFMSFYENCPVLKSEGDVRASRLALCKLAACVIQQGLKLLGIETLEQM